MRCTLAGYQHHGGIEAAIASENYALQTTSCSQVLVNYLTLCRPVGCIKSLRRDKTRPRKCWWDITMEPR